MISVPSKDPTASDTTSMMANHLVNNLPSTASIGVKITAMLIYRSSACKYVTPSAEMLPNSSSARSNDNRMISPSKSLKNFKTDELEMFGTPFNISSCSASMCSISEFSPNDFTISANLRGHSLGSCNIGEWGNFTNTEGLKEVWVSETPALLICEYFLRIVTKPLQIIDNTKRNMRRRKRGCRIVWWGKMARFFLRRKIPF